MRRFAGFAVVGLMLVVIHVSLNGQETGKKATSKAGTQANSKASASQPASDEAAVRQTGDTFIKAFNQADAKAIAEHFTEDGEYVSENGNVIQGRAAIEESYKTYFSGNPGVTLQMNIESIRFVGPGIAIEDGVTTVSRPNSSETESTRYTAVHLKNAGKWQVASVRDTSLKPRRQHKAKLQQLSWMLGDWVHEGSDAVINFSCQATDNGNFLVRNFTIKMAGHEEITGVQRIGWDAQEGKFRSWVFDSDGSHSEGYWHQDGSDWVLKSHGSTADGEPASSTSIYSFVNLHTMTFQSVDHEISGTEIPDSPKVTIVRRPPKPQ